MTAIEPAPPPAPPGYRWERIECEEVFNTEVGNVAWQLVTQDGRAIGFIEPLKQDFALVRMGQKLFRGTLAECAAELIAEVSR